MNDSSVEMDVRNSFCGNGLRLTNGHCCPVNKNYKSLHSNVKKYFYDTDTVSIDSCSTAQSQGYKTFFMFSSAETKIYLAHKC